MWGKREGVWGKCAFCKEKEENAGEKNIPERALRESSGVLGAGQTQHYPLRLLYTRRTWPRRPVSGGGGEQPLEQERVRDKYIPIKQQHGSVLGLTCWVQSRILTLEYTT